MEGAVAACAQGLHCAEDGIVLCEPVTPLDFSGYRLLFYRDTGFMLITENPVSETISTSGRLITRVV